MQTEEITHFNIFPGEKEEVGCPEDIVPNPINCSPA